MVSVWFRILRAASELAGNIFVYFVLLVASSHSETIVEMYLEIAITQQQRNKWLSRDTL